MTKSVLFFACIVFLAGCSLANVPAPKNVVDLLLDTTCDAPCVLGITPGVTTPDEARTIVNNNALLSNCEEHDLRTQGGVQWIDCNSKSFGIVFLDNTVAWISIAPSNLSIEQLMQKYGPPKALSIVVGNKAAEQFSSKAILVYEKIRAQITLSEKSGNKYEIDPNTQIEAIIFNSEQQQTKVVAKVVGAWKGYGIYLPQ